MSEDLDGVIVAVPNRLHLEVGGFFANHGVHILVEKPIADSLTAGKELVDQADRKGVQLLVGHHRRYNNRVSIAQHLVRERLGILVATQTMITMKKPDSSYDIEWRRGLDTGPLMVDLVHEVDLLRAVFDEIDRVRVR